MGIKKNIIDAYYQFLEDKYCCETSDQLLGKKYIISEEFGTGNFLRMQIESGLDLSSAKVDKIELKFDNRELDDNILEVGYCYSGEIEILSLPNQKIYNVKAGDAFIYQMLNDIDYFRFKYNNAKAMSIHMNFNTIKNAVNPIWENKLILDWQKNINNIFNEKVLIIERASYNLKQIAEEINKISGDNMMGYMKLKLKTIEFLATFLEEELQRNAKNIKREYLETTNQAKEIINKDLENTPSVNELADILKTSVYKLQQGFKEITGDTVYQYIKKQRVEEAEYLIKHTEMSILEIANEVGYQNPSKFASSFKEYHQITPLKYRKSHKNDL